METDPAAPSPQSPRNLVLIGFMGTGKSSVGKLAAKTLGFQFIDTDQVIVERAGRQISEIFETDGEAAFRTLETEALESLAHLSRCVISTGGGAVLLEHNRQLLRELGYVVCLTASEDVLFERVSRNTKRPLLQTENPRATLSRLIEERSAIYREAAHHTLDTSLLAQSAAVEALVHAARQAFAWNHSS
jgi:shikimate kinase